MPALLNWARCISYSPPISSLDERVKRGTLMHFKIKILVDMALHWSHRSK
jgi:hypothetical protein